MGFREYVIRRMLINIPTLVGLSILIFALTRALPGNPAQLALGETATREQVEFLTHLWGLDRPIYAQYFIYVRNFLFGDWGVSFNTMHNVREDIIRLLPATIELTVVGMFIAVVIGVATGVAAALNRNKWQDSASRLVSLGGVSVPRFWVGILLQIAVAYWAPMVPITGRIGIGVKPPLHITGFYLLDSMVTVNWEAFWSSLIHIILPAFTLSLSAIANISRLTRSCMIDEQRKDYIQASIANGLPHSLVVYKYMLKNAFTATLTMITLMFAFYFGGSVLVETVFNWPGIGLYLFQAIYQKDVNSITGVILIVGAAVVLFNFVTDLLYGYLDPRIRYGEER